MGMRKAEVFSMEKEKVRERRGEEAIYMWSPAEQCEANPWHMLVQHSLCNAHCQRTMMSQEMKAAHKD